MADSVNNISNAISSRPIKLTIGREPDSKSFFVHRGLLQAHSTSPEIFDKNPDVSAEILAQMKLTRDDRGNLSLEDDDPKAFAMLIHVLYKSLLMFDGNTIQHIPSLYLMCERLGFESTMNMIMDGLQEYDRGDRDHYFSVPDIRYIHDNAKPCSKLRKYVLCSIACRTSWGRLSNDWALAFMKFLEDCPGMGAQLFVTNAGYGKRIAKFKADYRKPAAQNGFGRCEFHIHPPGVSCHTQSGSLSRREQSTLDEFMNIVKYEENGNDDNAEDDAEEEEGH